MLGSSEKNDGMLDTQRDGVILVELSDRSLGNKGVSSSVHGVGLEILQLRFAEYMVT